MSSAVDLAIAGAGPSGLALAASALELGAEVALVDPTPERPWVPTWCAFQRDLPPWVPVARSWASARVDLPSRTLRVEGPYAEVDREAFQAALRVRSAAALRVVGEAAAREPGGLRLADGSFVEARAVVDCTGTGVLEPARATAFQTAWGLLVETDGHPWDPAEATWMDLRGLQTPASFLYALPRDERTVFVEETSLAARPAMPLPTLAARLDARLAGLGVRVRRVLAEERCVIPLDRPVPRGLAFGVAGAMVHPATGYLLARVLASAPDVARGILAGRGPQALSAARGGGAHALHRLGLEVLLRADGPGTTAFFESFFAAPASVRDGFLDPRATTVRTALAMGRLFVGAPGRVRKDLARPLFTPFQRASQEMPCTPSIAHRPVPSEP